MSGPQATAPAAGRWRIAIDTGGTFTDCVAVAPDGRSVRCKVLSSAALRGRVTAIGPERGEVRVSAGWLAPDGWAVGMRVTRAARSGPGARITAFRRAGPGQYLITLGPGGPPPAVGEDIALRAGCEAPVLAARLATGTAMDADLPPLAMRLATTRTTNALLERKTAPLLLVTRAGLEDLLDIGDQRRPDLFALDIHKPRPLHVAAVGVGAWLAPDGRMPGGFDEAAARRTVARALEGRPEIRAAAVVLPHAIGNPAPERALARILRDLGIPEVTCSHEVPSAVRLLDRAQTAAVDAGLNALLRAYLERIGDALGDGRLDVMTSAGGLVAARAYRAKDSLLSGPAGGVAGAADVARRAGFPRCIAFDMGGTSTDVSRIDGDFDYRFTTLIDGQRVSAPSLRIVTVASGGGSVCRIDSEAATVGPDSAGADPGPACYGGGGPLALTDAHLLLGRIDPGAFAIPVSPEAAASRLGERLRDAAIPDSEAARLLDGLLRVADETMASAIRSITGAEGHDPSDHALVAFGGAGGLHACRIANLLGIRDVLVPADAGLLSARGLEAARREHIAERAILRPLAVCVRDLPGLFDGLAREARDILGRQGDAPVETHRRIIEFRLVGQEATLTADWSPGQDAVRLCASRYREVFGYDPGARPVECVGVKVVARGIREPPVPEEFPEDGSQPTPTHRVQPPVGDASPLPVFPRRALAPGDRLRGPCLVQDAFSTLVIEDGWSGVVGTAGTLRLGQGARAVPARRPGRSAGAADALVESQLFANRLAALVAEAGEQLERTAVSTNVKDRRDFSCALLDADGRLVVNAPHIPVHLGALGSCVRRVMRATGMRPGDVIVTNHPAFGGSHLPDVTVVTPFFLGGDRPAAFLANRAHHAEIGGVAPGSMPPGATRLDEEGVILPPTHLVAAGRARLDAVRELLTAAPHPSRAPDDNLADLEAQIAANQRAVGLLARVATGLDPAALNERFRRILDASARLLAGRLPDPGAREAVECLDDGTRIAVRITVAGGAMTFDFTGTSPRHPGNLNATPAIVRSAVLYVLRLLVAEPIPLNEGLLANVGIRLPPGFLNPGFEADPLPAVAAGNTETSQRVVDTLLRALGLAACSQGTMNNLLFGNKRFGYYETIGGGCGATRHASGADAVHSHMTNTAITDPEVLERRHPVRLRAFLIRRGSGGPGRHPGGNGIIRVIEFLEDCDLSLITQHRVDGPFGMHGGHPGEPGRQWMVRADGTREPLGSSASVTARPGDRIHIETPGGGGWG